MGRFYSVTSWHNTILLARTDSGYIENGSSGMAGTVPVVAYVGQTKTQVAYLAADLPNDMTLKLHPLPTVGRIVPVGVTSDASQDMKTFYSPWDRRFMVVGPPSTSTQTGHAVLVTEQPNEYEQVSFTPIKQSEVPPILLEAQRYLDLVVDAPVSARNLIDIIRSITNPTLARDIINAAGLLLPYRELEALAQHLVSHPQDLKLLVALYPNDLAAQYGLRGLIGWLDSEKLRANPSSSVVKPNEPRLPLLRRWFSKPQDKKDMPPHPVSAVQHSQAKTYIIDNKFDVLDTIGLWGDFVSLPHACNMVGRQLAKPKKRACILATARNEGLYILDWLSYHRGIGFDSFFVYSNDNTDGSDELLAALDKAGEIRWIKSIVSRGTKPQWKAYNHALQLLPDILDFEWTLVIDLDELFSLNPTYFQTVSDYLNWVERGSVDAIAFNWLSVFSNREVLWREDTLRRRFPVKKTNMSTYVKSMFRTSKFPVSMPHHPIEFGGRGFDFRAPSMKPFVFDRSLGPGMSMEIDAKFAWISHYFFKSSQEFLFKISRPRGDEISSGDEEFSAAASNFIRDFVAQQEEFVSHSEEDVFDLAATAHLSQVKANPAVASAFERIKLHYERRFAVLLARAAVHPAILEAGEAGHDFLERIWEHARCGKPAKELL